MIAHISICLSILCVVGIIILDIRLHRCEEDLKDLYKSRQELLEALLIQKDKAKLNSRDIKLISTAMEELIKAFEMLIERTSSKNILTYTKGGKA